LERDGGEIIEVVDEIIELIECNEKADAWSQDVNIYCPNFEADHFLYGDYTSDKFSWLKLAIHYCDESLRTCEEKDEIDRFFRTNIVALKLQKNTPQLLTFEHSL